MAQEIQAPQMVLTAATLFFQLLPQMVVGVVSVGVVEGPVPLGVPVAVAHKEPPEEQERLVRPDKVITVGLVLLVMQLGVVVVLVRLVVTEIQPGLVIIKGAMEQQLVLLVLQ